MGSNAVRRRCSVPGWLLVALLAMAGPGPAAAAETLALAGVEYEHRWSRNGQNEYTPAGQEDLERWRDMLSLVVRADVADAEGLAAVANGLLEDYRKMGAIVRTDSRPATPGQPAEHLIVALLGGGPMVEAAFARLVLHEGTGVIVVRSRRAYGEDAATEAGAWLRDHGLVTELALWGWAPLPPIARLQALPQADAP